MYIYIHIYMSHTLHPYIPAMYMSTYIEISFPLTA